MARYSESELIQLRATAYVPQQFDFAEFAKSVEEQREAQAEEGLGQRRLSHGGSKKPFKPRVRRVHETPQPDADGWVTLNKKKQSFGADEATQHRETFRESAKADTTQVRVRPNNKKIGSNKPSDPRDILDQTKSTFNAFAALGDESDDSDEDEDQDEEKENDD